MCGICGIFKFDSVPPDSKRIKNKRISGFNYSKLGIIDFTNLRLKN